MLIKFELWDCQDNLDFHQSLCCVPLSFIDWMISQLKEKYCQWIPIVHLSSCRLQKEEALKARVVKANETGEKEKVFISRFLFVLLAID